MTTTSSFQVKPDFYSSKEECEKSLSVSYNTNPRYSHYNQTHFTAGDIDQFFSYIDSSSNLSEKIPEFCDTFYHDMWEKNVDITPDSLSNTFKYIFHKFKKGIYVKIQDNKLKVFLPFSKKNFTNEWHSHIRHDPKYKTFTDYFRVINPKLKDNEVNKYVDSWYGNGCLIRYEFPINEGDTNNTNLKDMLICLCAERKVPDIEFFLNRRDFPIIKKNGTEAYEDLFESDCLPLVSHNYNKYLPILSMVGKIGYADIPIPTGDDWARVEMPNNKYFAKNCRDYLCKFSKKWKDKKNMAVFRGASTGNGTTIETNQRLKLAYLSTIHSDLLDAGITNWNTRPRKNKNEKYLTHIDINKLPFGLVQKLTPEEQSGYKYIVHVDGHVSAFRLSLELSMGCCLLIADSDYHLFFREKLVAYKHYIPIEKDLSDLIEKIKWCRDHDDECKRISEHAKKFYEQHLTRNGLLDYMQNLLCFLKQKGGNYKYNTLSLRTIQTNFIEKRMGYDFPEIKKKTISLVNKTFPKFATKTFGLLKGIEYVLNYYLSTLSKTEQPTLFNNQQKIFNSKNGNVKKVSFLNESLIVKSIHKDKYYDGIHELFVSKKINKLREIIPNFCYIYTFMGDTQRQFDIISEYIEGEMFSEYIKGNRFDIKEFVNIIYMICLSLHVAQQSCGFIHNDFAPWNIVLKRFDTVQEIEYPISQGVVIKVKTFVVPIIIDYGKSHIIYKDCHFGNANLNPFSMDTFHDIITIVFTSLFEISVHPESRYLAKELLTIGNYFTGGEYHKEKFHTLGDLKHFLYNSKKFSEMSFSDKKEFKNKSPIDFCKFLEKEFSIKFGTSKFMTRKKNHDPITIFNYVVSDSDEEKIKSFTDQLKKGYDSKDPFINFYTNFYKQKHDLDLIESLKDYTKNKGIKYDAKYDARSPNFVSPRVPELKINLNVPNLTDDTIFLFPERLITINYTKRKLLVYNALRELSYYIDVQIKLPDISSILNVVNENTIMKFGTKIFENDLKNFKCKNRKTFQKIIKKINISTDK